MIAHQEKYHLFMAINYLKTAISNRDSEEMIRKYIKLIEGIEEKEREKVLLNPEIIKLINRINMGVEEWVNVRNAD